MRLWGQLPQNSRPSDTLKFRGPSRGFPLTNQAMESVNNNSAVMTPENQGQLERAVEAEVVEPESAVTTESAVPIVSALPTPDPEELERLKKENKELRDLVQRNQAEFQNYRRRVERERGELLEFAAMDTVKALLPILDDFERAVKVESTDKEYARGTELIYQRLTEALAKLGLEPISSEVPIFNPHVHHAVEMVDTKEHPDQTILDEFQRGYSFKGRLLRPAMVKVAVNP
jgi:molecular chaperone GrpE